MRILGEVNSPGPADPDCLPLSGSGPGSGKTPGATRRGVRRREAEVGAGCHPKRHPPRHGGGGLREERGSGTVMAMGLILLGATLILGMAQVGVAAAGSASARQAGDLAAIAGATAVLMDQDGCSTAGEYAVKNGARLTSCSVSGWMVTVTVAKPLAFGLVREATTTSRAGPEFLG